jgi:hypothetical protein
MLAPTLNPKHYKRGQPINVRFRRISGILILMVPASCHLVRLSNIDTFSLRQTPRSQKSTTQSLAVALPDTDWTYTNERQREQGGGTLEEEYDHHDTVHR